MWERPQHLPSHLRQWRRRRSSSTADAETLRVENAQLREQLAAMQKKLDGLKKGAGKSAKTATQQKTAENPPAMKELDPAYGNIGKANIANAAQVQSDPKTGNADQAQSSPSKTAAEMTCGANMKFKMPEGSQFYYNPVFGGTDNMYHTHPEGMWMVNTKLMHMEMDGLQAGTTPIAATDVGPGIYPGSPSTNVKYPYMMIPTKMSMDMGMAMAMYGVTDQLTVMAMLNYKATNMNMFMDMGNTPGSRIWIRMISRGLPRALRCTFHLANGYRRSWRHRAGRHVQIL